jgi:hypothetical protein
VIGTVTIVKPVISFAKMVADLLIEQENIVSADPENMMIF